MTDLVLVNQLMDDLDGHIYGCEFCQRNSKWQCALFQKLLDQWTVAAGMERVYRD